jgi:hypothetical protein
MASATAKPAATVTAPKSTTPETTTVPAIVSVEVALRATTAVTGVAAFTDKLETADIGLTTVAGAIVGVNVEEATRDAVAERTLAAADISELVAASATVGRTVSMAVVVSVLVAVSDADAPEAPSYGTAARYPVPSR